MLFTLNLFQYAFMPRHIATKDGRISDWTKHTMLTIFRLHTISSISIGKSYFPTCLLI